MFWKQKDLKQMTLKGEEKIGCKGTIEISIFKKKYTRKSPLKYAPDFKQYEDETTCTAEYVEYECLFSVMF